MLFGSPKTHTYGFGRDEMGVQWLSAADTVLYPIVLWKQIIKWEEFTVNEANQVEQIFVDQPINP